MYLLMATDADRLAQLLGVAALAATDRLRGAVESELAHGGSAPAALVHLQAHPGGSVESLRHVLGISQPAAARLVEQLVTEGQLERRPGADRRTHALHLTRRGDRAATALLERRASSLRELLSVLGPRERAALMPLLERLVSGLAHDRAGALRACRMCDRGACTSGPGCPMEHTA
jgi:DNA-binding MarR family transcriptional regulator